MYISNGSACQQGSCPRSSWPEWDRIASDGLSQLCGPPVEQLRRLGHHIVSRPQEANLSLPRSGSHRPPSSRKGLAPCTAFFRSLLCVILFMSFWAGHWARPRFKVENQIQPPGQRSSNTAWQRAYIGVGGLEACEHVVICHTLSPASTTATSLHLSAAPAFHTCCSLCLGCSFFSFPW